MGFQIGDKVEISINEEGFLGSYYAATIIYPIVNNSYLVQYETILKDDKSRDPLREIVSADAVRPVPSPLAATRFFKNEKVDAFYDDGWWVGLISGKVNRKNDDDDNDEEEKYFVYFQTTREEIAYSVSQLRVHLDWVNGTNFWNNPNNKRL